MSRNVAIVALLVVNLVLATAVIFTVTTPPTAHAQVAASASYAIVAGGYGEGWNAVYIIDLATQRMAVVDISAAGGITNLSLKTMGNVDLQNDFRAR